MSNTKNLILAVVVFAVVAGVWRFGFGENLGLRFVGWSAFGSLTGSHSATSRRVSEVRERGEVPASAKVTLTRHKNPYVPPSAVSRG